MNDGFVWCPHCLRPHLLGQRFCPLTGRPIERNLHRLTTGVPPIIGKVVSGKYEILEPIARGGVGIVFEALDLVLDRRVAIKIVTDPLAKESATRLRREAKLVAGIHHPNVCIVHDAGELPNGLPYVVMERLHGETFAERLRRDGPLCVADAAEVMFQVLSGLAAAHSARVIHRDIKPSNLFLVDVPDGTLHVKLLDFGYAKDVSASSASRLTAPGQAVGTPIYMAPELLRGEPATATSDVFACGMVFFEMLSGRHPFEGGSVLEVTRSILQAPPRDLRTVAPQWIPSALQDVVLQALAKDESERFFSIDAMRNALASAMKSEGRNRAPRSSARLRAVSPEEHAPSSSSG